jgi:hypothetical protein
MEGALILAESHVYRQLRFEVIDMTNLTEAKLAREAEFYSTVAMIWTTLLASRSRLGHPRRVTNLNKSAENAGVIREALRAMPAERSCDAGAGAPSSPIHSNSGRGARRLSVIAGKYLTPGAR